MHRYQVKTMFGQGTFGRLYQAHLRPDLPDADMPQWVFEQKDRRERRRASLQQSASELEESRGKHASASADAVARSVSITRCAYSDDEIHEECRVDKFDHSKASEAEQSAAEIALARDELVVIKEVPFQGLPPQEQQDILNEVRVMSAVDHSSFITYYDSFLDNGCLYIVMEFAKGGDLAQLLNKHKPNPMPESEMWRYLLQLLEGLSYLHSQRILHRDIKPANIFLDGDLDIKIGDLGLGRILGSKSVVARTGVGTPLYFSPELVMDQPYDEKSDIWSLGCLLYEMATFQPPFLATNQIALAKKIVNDIPASLPSTYSSELRFLIMKMLEKDATKRPSIDQMLQYSPVKLRRQQAQLSRTVENMLTKLRHQRYFMASIKTKNQQLTAQHEQALQQQQRTADAQLQQSQKTYEQVYELLQSSEAAHATLLTRLYALEQSKNDASDSQQQLFEQYKLQLTRGQQERVQLEIKLQQQDSLLNQQSSTIQALTNKLQQAQMQMQSMQLQQQQQQQQQKENVQQLHPTMSSPAIEVRHPHIHASQARMNTTSPPPISALPFDKENALESDSASLLASGTPQMGVTTHVPISASVVPAILPIASASMTVLPPSKCPSPSLSSAHSMLSHAPASSPQSSPLVARFNKVSRTPNLGPALRVPLNQTHTSPVKAAHYHKENTGNQSNTITPKKKPSPAQFQHYATSHVNSTFTPSAMAPSSVAAPTLYTTTPVLASQHTPPQSRLRPQSNASDLTMDELESAREHLRQLLSDTPPRLISPGLESEPSSVDSTPLRNSSIYVHPATTSPILHSIHALTNNPLQTAQATAEWNDLIAEPASRQKATVPLVQHKTSQSNAWPLNSQQLDWLLLEAEAYDNHAEQ